MKKLGDLSASQIVSAFKHDFALKKYGVKWPEEIDTPRLELPLCRFKALASVRHPFAMFPTLECIWSLAEMSQDEFLEQIHSYHAPAGGLNGAWTLKEFISAFQRDPLIFGEEMANRVSALRKGIRSGDFAMTDFIIVTADSSREFYPACPDGKYCLLDGHHRLLALVGENRLSNSVHIIVGELPRVRIGVAILNGYKKEG